MHGVTDNRFEDGRDVDRDLADRAEDLAGGGLLIKRDGQGSVASLQFLVQGGPELAELAFQPLPPQLLATDRLSQARVFGKQLGPRRARCPHVRSLRRARPRLTIRYHEMQLLTSVDYRDVSRERADGSTHARSTPPAARRTIRGGARQHICFRWPAPLAARPAQTAPILTRSLRPLCRLRSWHRPGCARRHRLVGRPRPWPRLR